MTEKESGVQTESKEGQEAGKEEVVCPVCSNFEPQAWRKTMCKNCFHPLDDHGKESDKPETKESPKVNDLEDKKAKSKDAQAKDKSSKSEPPKPLPKTGLAAKNKGLSLVTKKPGEGDDKDKIPTPTSKTPVKHAPGAKDIGGDTDKGKVSPFTSSSSKKQTTHEKNAAFDAKTTNKQDNKKQSEAGPSALSKWKNNESNLTSSKEKGSPDVKTKDALDWRDRKKAEEAKKSADDKKATDDKLKTKSLEGKGAFLLKDSVNKSKAAEISKGKHAESAEGGVTKVGSDRSKSKVSDLPTSPINVNKPGIKQHLHGESTQKQKLGTPAGADKDKKETSSASKESSALGEKVNKFSALTNQESNKNGTLERRKGSFGKFSKNEKESSPMEPVSTTEGKRLDGELEGLKKKLNDMERKCNTLEKENTNLKKGLQDKEQLEGNLQKQKLDVENAIKGLQGQLNAMVSRCSKLETDNTGLLDKLKDQQKLQEKAVMENASSEQLKEMEADLNQSEIDIENLQDENEKLKTEIQDLKVEMDEMYDSFREQEAEEFRDLQRELEMTAKNCRVLQFKLRKAERRGDQVEADRQHYEEKLRILQNQFEDADARAHIETIEDELRMAKEVSVRLHDELDILDDKRQKVEEENSHLTRLLEHSDKKQFRLEMEVDKLRDQLADMRKQLAEKSHPGTPSTEEISDRKSIYTVLLDE